MGEVIQFKPKQRRCPDQYFGGCPFCGGMDGIVDVGRVSWCVCRRHRVRWCIGPKIPDNPDSWIYEVKRLTPFRVVRPIFPDDDQVPQPAGARRGAALA
jgi:hypothetical protein